MSTVGPCRTYFLLLLLRPTSRSCLDPYCPPDLRCIGGSSASTPAWYRELRLRREGANRCVSVRARAQAASQLKPATAFLLGTACFLHCGALGFPCGCGPVAQGRMWQTHALLPMPSLPPLVVLVSFSSSSLRRGLRRLLLRVHQRQADLCAFIIYHSPFVMLSFSPSSLAPLTLSNLLLVLATPPCSKCFVAG